MNLRKLASTNRMVVSYMLHTYAAVCSCHNDVFLRQIPTEKNLWRITTCIEILFYQTLPLFRASRACIDSKSETRIRESRFLIDMAKNRISKLSLALNNFLELDTTHTRELKSDNIKSKWVRVKIDINGMKLTRYTEGSYRQSLSFPSRTEVLKINFGFFN